MSTRLSHRRLKTKSEKYVSVFLLLWTTCMVWAGQWALSEASPVPITNYFKEGTISVGLNTGSTESPLTFSQHSSSSWNWNKPKPSQPAASEAQSWNFDPRKDDFLNWDNKLGTDDSRVNIATSIVEVIVYIVIALVILSFVSFLICICCPICVLAKIRNRRRGHIYARQTGIPIATTSLTHPQTSQVIAITNQTSSAPYPVQETVAVIPLISQQAIPYSIGVNLNNQELRNYGAKPPNYISVANGMPSINSTEPPPPYSPCQHPGLLPSSIAANHDLHQHSYNPYFAEEIAQNPNK